VLSTSHRREKRRAQGLPSWRLVRYADDFVVLVNGTRQDTEALREEVAGVLAPMGLRLPEAKTQVVHLSEGFDFLGVRHEAPSIRVEVKDCHRCAVAAA
jgi:RNA-directed DNA polymerase